MKKFNFFTLLFCSFLLQAPSYASSSTQIDDLASAFMKQNNVDGMSIAVINKDKTVIYSYGLANEITKKPITSNTIYTIASFTKTFTATLAATASVENKLNLDAPFTDYFPQLKNNSDLNKITTSELLGHVSSLPFDFKPRPKTYAAAVNDLDQFKSSTPPGSQFGYSNAGIGTVGYILQNVYTKNYQQILTEKVLTPLNMHSTYLIVPKEKVNAIAVGHDKDNQDVAYDPTIDVWFAAASLKSTISDMAKYLNAQINDSSLTDATLAKAISLVHQNKYCFASGLACEQLAWQAHVISELKKSTDDTFFTVYDSNGTPMFNKEAIVENKYFSKNRIFIDKTGSGYGMSSYMAYIPDQKIGVVILLNKTIGDERIKLGRDILLSM